MMAFKTEEEEAWDRMGASGRLRCRARLRAGGTGEHACGMLQYAHGASWHGNFGYSCKWHGALLKVMSGTVGGVQMPSALCLLVVIVISEGEGRREILPACISKRRR